ncbi:hypothetical protein [Halorussus amylolyticus]|uniref:hypothetical protein n=1 Tax=Halorussus amylolyticus TaxID=1126242 RepID=UPI001053EAC7|nr:hypothetical protein [Halorussus amylolyticus]
MLWRNDFRVMLTTEKPSERLTDFLENRAGDHLRSVLQYDSDDKTVVHVRDDVADEYSDDDVAAVMQDLRLEAIEKSHQESLYDHGELNCTVRCFDDAIELHFPREEAKGTVVALDADVLEAEAALVGECMDALGDTAD